jgi:hypothetical protein
MKCVDYERKGSSGRTRTYNPRLTARSLSTRVHVFSMTYPELNALFGAHSASVAAKFAAKFSNQPEHRTRLTPRYMLGLSQMGLGTRSLSAVSEAPSEQKAKS